MKKLIISILMLFCSFSYAKPKIGVTLLPLYSFVTNIVDDKMDVVQILPTDINSHSYDPTIQDIKNLATVDIIVINGVGHDDFVYKMIDAAKQTNKNLKVINANEKTGLMFIQGQKYTNISNPHTHISITQSIEQIDHIASELGKLDPQNAKFYRKNAKIYDAKLRAIKRDTFNKINGKLDGIKIATTHAGYDYLLSEFGLPVSTVVESSYTQSPSAADLKIAIDKIKANNINILFDEENGNHKNAKLIEKETGIYVSTLNHVTNGEYTKDAFEKFIKLNMDSIANAILEINKRK